MKLYILCRTLREKTIPCPAANPRTGYIRENGVHTSPPPPPPGPMIHVGKAKRERERVTLEKLDSMKMITTET